MKSKIDITGVSETMLQTLYARAKETNSQNAKIKDDIAVHIVENIDYDFSKADKDSAMSSGVIARTIGSYGRTIFKCSYKCSCSKCCMWVGYSLLQNER